VRNLDEDLFEDELIEEDIDIEDLYEDIPDPRRPVAPKGYAPKGGAPKTPHTNPAQMTEVACSSKPEALLTGPVSLIPNGGLS
jgi:hypothetical protein